VRETYKRTFTREEVELDPDAHVLWSLAQLPHVNPVFYTVEEDSVTFWWRVNESE
jgi:hypothetical protein